jgi:hypothetical protein
LSRKESQFLSLGTSKNALGAKCPQDVSWVPEDPEISRSLTGGFLKWGVAMTQSIEIIRDHPSQSQTWGFVCQEPEAEAEDAKLDGELTKLTKKAMPK